VLIVPFAFSAVTVNEPATPAVVGDGKPVTVKDGLWTGVSRTAWSCPEASTASAAICPELLIAIPSVRVRPEPAGTRLFRSVMTPLLSMKAWNVPAEAVFAVPTIWPLLLMALP
jgi:hypothetical protein